MSTPACEDADTIARRIAEIQAERMSALNKECDCPRGVSTDGSAFKVHDSICPHYRRPEGLCDNGCCV